MRKFLAAMTILIGLTSLPYLNELVTNKDGSLISWLVSPEIQESWKSESGRILGYSKFRVMLFYVLIQLNILIASLGWYSVAKNKAYRGAILICSVSAIYHIFLILSENRKTYLNDIEFKLIGTITITVLLLGIYIISEYRKKKQLRSAYSTFESSPKAILNTKVAFGWACLAFISIFPYLHDIISPRGLGVQQWVPLGGLEDIVMLGERNFLGFASYRALVLTFFVQLFAQMMWAGWWMDAKYSLYKPFLLIPLGINFYQLTLILMVKSDTYLNKPDIKLYLTLVFGLIIGIIYYFKNKSLKLYKKESIKNVLHQNN